MLERLFGFRRDSPDETPSRDDLRLAVAALLVEAAHMDGTFDPDERETVVRLLTDRFPLDASSAAALVAEAEEAVAGAAEIWSWARVVKDRFDPAERIEMIEMLWEVAYADGELHHYEANLLRRVAGLIHVEDRDSGAARKRVLAKLGHRN